MQYLHWQLSKPHGSIIPMVMVPKRQLIGVLGGMGPAATVDFLQKIVVATPAGRDQEHVPVIVHSIPQIPDRSTAIREGSDAPFLPMLAGIRLLEQSGADVIAIPCNTAHYWFERLSKATRVKIIHIVDAVGDALEARAANGAVALLATRGTLESGLYQDRLKGAFSLVGIPCEAIQDDIDRAIAAVKAGKVKAAQDMAVTIDRALAAAGYQAAILACTELPVAFEYDGVTLDLIDATEALAKACVKVSLDVWPASLAAAS